MSIETHVRRDAATTIQRPVRARTSAPAADIDLGFRDFDPALHTGGLHRAGWERRYLWTAVVLDFGIAAIAGLVGFALRFEAPTDAIKLKYLGFAALLPLIWVALLMLNRAYERRHLYAGSEETRRVLRAGIMLIAGVSFVAYATQQDFSRGYMLGSFPFLIAGTAIGRYRLRKSLHGRRERGACLQRAIVVGHVRPVQEMIARLQREQHHGIDVVAFCLPPGVDVPTDHVWDVGPQLTALDVVDAVGVYDASMVIVLASPEYDGERLRRLSWRLERSGAEMLVAPALVDVTGPRTSVRLAAGLPLLHVEPPEFGGLRRLAKSTMDRTAAGLGLLFLMPLLLVLAVLIRLEDGGPAVFKQRRVGRHGKEFVLFKFRSMHVDAEQRLAAIHDRNENDGVLFKMRDDPRITRVGKFLRRYSLDELPQLVNVLRGEMSLVGPRPPLPSEVSAYKTDLRRRLVVAPGLTGLWQVSGRSDLSWDESMYLDLHYVENWSPALDLMILLKTTRAVVRATGAY